MPDKDINEWFILIYFDIENDYFFKQKEIFTYIID